jgi:hypothetical protein
MEPITTAIVSAIVAGAAASAQGVVSQAVSDAYSALKTLIVERYQRANAVAKIEEDPESEPSKASLVEALTESGAVADAQVQQGAARLSTALAELPEEAKSKLSVQLRNIEAGRSILLENLRGADSVEIAVEGAKTQEDFILRGVSTGRPLSER